MNKLFGSLLLLCFAPVGEIPDAGSGDASNDIYGAGTDTQEPVTSNVPETSSDSTPAVTTGAAPAVAPTSTPAVAPTLRIDPDDLASLARAVQPQTSSQQPAFSQEEIDRLTKPVRVTADDLIALGFENPTDKQIAAYQAMFNRTTEHHRAILGLALQQQRAQFESDLAPLRNTYQEVQQSRVESQFYGKFSDLKTYDPVVKMAAREVQPNMPNGRPKSADQIFEEVAQRSRQILKTMNIDTTAPVATPGAGDGVTSVPRPNVAPTPGRSTAPTPRGGNKNADADIYT